MTDSNFRRLRLALSAAKVASHVARERIRRPVPSTSAGVPHSPADISPEWLSSALYRAPGTLVESVRVVSESVDISCVAHPRECRIPDWESHWWALARNAGQDFAGVYQSLRSVADTSRARVRAMLTSEAVTTATPNGRCPSGS
jgi:hypothetical protein